MRVIRGKKALVTGAASGIGRAIAQRLASEGVDMFLVDVNEVGLTEIAAEVRAAGVAVHTRQCDVGNPGEVTATVTELLVDWGGVDILVNNAGITYYGKTEEMSAEHWDQVLRVNLHSHIQFTRELLPSLLARREAHVLNVCSMFGLVAMPKLAAYCTTKFGLVGFSDALRAEYGRDGLGVTAMCPGFVTTKLFTSAPKVDAAKDNKVPPRILCTTPEKVAKAAVRAIRRDRRVVILAPVAWLLVGAKKFVPGVVDFLLHLGKRRRIKRKMAALEGKRANQERQAA